MTAPKRRAYLVRGGSWNRRAEFSRVAWSGWRVLPYNFLGVRPVAKAKGKKL